MISLRLTKAGTGGKESPLYEGKVPSAGFILRAEEGEAHLQLEVTQREIRVGGDGGGNSSWEIEVAVPRLKEPPPKPQPAPKSGA